MCHLRTKCSVVSNDGVAICNYREYTALKINFGENLRILGFQQKYKFINVLMS